MRGNSYISYYFWKGLTHGCYLDFDSIVKLFSRLTFLVRLSHLTWTFDFGVKVITIAKYRLWLFTWTSISWIFSMSTRFRLYLQSSSGENGRKIQRIFLFLIYVNLQFLTSFAHGVNLVVQVYYSSDFLWEFFGIIYVLLVVSSSNCYLGRFLPYKIALTIFSRYPFTLRSVSNLSLSSFNPQVPYKPFLLDLRLSLLFADNWLLDWKCIYCPVCVGFLSTDVLSSESSWVPWRFTANWWMCIYISKPQHVSLSMMFSYIFFKPLQKYLFLLMIESHRQSIPLNGKPFRFPSSSYFVGRTGISPLWCWLIVLFIWRVSFLLNYLQWFFH